MTTSEDVMKHFDTVTAAFGGRYGPTYGGQNDETCYGGALLRMNHELCIGNGPSLLRQRKTFGNGYWMIPRKGTRWRRTLVFSSEQHR